MTETAAIVQALAAILAIRRYPVFALSLAAWLPVMWTWSPWSPAWESSIWLWCAVPFTLLQAMATIEAFYSFAKGFWWSVRASVALVLFSVAAMLYIFMRPADSFLGQVVQVAKYERVGASVFLILAVALCVAIVDKPSILWRTPKGRHLLLLADYMLTWMVPAAMLAPDAPEWRSVTAWVIPIRAIILATWIFAVRAHQSDHRDDPAPACGSLGGSGFPQSTGSGICTRR